MEADDIEVLQLPGTVAATDEKLLELTQAGHVENAILGVVPHPQSETGSAGIVRLGNVTCKSKLAPLAKGAAPVKTQRAFHAVHTATHLARLLQQEVEEIQRINNTDVQLASPKLAPDLECFEQIDLDGSGFVTKDEMKERVLMTCIRSEELDELLEETLQHADRDGDGRLNQEEFRRFCSEALMAQQPGFFERHRFLIEVLVVVLFFLAAPLTYCNTEDGWSVWDALYFAAVTLTTVGYGDLSPGSDGMRLFTMFYMLIGLLIVWSIFDLAVSRFVEEYQRQVEKLHKQVSRRIPTRPSLQNEEQVMMTPRSKQRKHARSFGWKMCRKYVALSLLMIFPLAVGTVVISLNEGWSWFHGFYWSTVTAATVGYGDLTLTKESSRIFATVFVLTGFACASCIIGELAAIKVEWSEHRNCQKLLARSLSLNTFADMTKEGHSLDRCAFVTAMLVQMGKVSDDDITPLLLKFDELDKDGDGVLTPEDVQLMQRLKGDKLDEGRTVGA